MSLSTMMHVVIFVACFSALLSADDAVTAPVFNGIRPANEEDLCTSSSYMFINTRLYGVTCCVGRVYSYTGIDKSGMAPSGHLLRLPVSRTVEIAGHPINYELCFRDVIDTRRDVRGFLGFGQGLFYHSGMPNKIGH